MDTNNLNGPTSKNKKISPDPLTDDQIRRLKQEIRRVHVKYMKQEEVSEKRQYLLCAKTQFATIMFNLKEKGMKLTELCKYTN